MRPPESQLAGVFFSCIIISMDKRLQWAIAKILERVHPQFHGTVTICFKNGLVHTLKTEESEMPPGLTRP